ncbi:S8 family serine peptidase [Amycolatopsis magusensis]|uniref:S8 family serine peptidase n=1 Tax=Amycolatopsis magusensis TaxID=882444 RepID=UPI0024A9DC90|nr:S8 family serine peptidase [Amycolatopsis magusensis]MDI5982557.1 S8 family serine peptidase [Amycolatopsis magusensis]
MATAACLAVAAGVLTPAAAAADPAADVQEKVLQQIAALQELKRAQGPADAKVDSHLLVEQQRRAQRAPAGELSALDTGAKVTERGTVTVDIRATEVTDDLLAGLSAVGAELRTVSAKAASIRAELPLDAVTTLAQRADVRLIEPAVQAVTAHQLNNPGNGTARAPRSDDAPVQSKDEFAAKLQAELSQAEVGIQAGPVTSEGDRAHNADTARQQYGISGAGVKICALSDGVASLTASQAKGELPPSIDVLPGQEGSGDEGTAMLEIIHDVAPGADLGFATAFSSDAGFADNIRKLRFDAGCDIIVDDVLYFKESPFQDWIIAQAVNEVTTDGALYFSSAGNEGNTSDGTTAHWEGDFADSGLQAGKFSGAAHDFAGAGGTQIFQPISDASSASVVVTLFWSDPVGKSANDYDLYLFNSAGAVVAMSQNNQTGAQDPYERLDTPTFGGTGLRLAVVKYSGENRYLSLSGLGGRFSDSADGLKAYTTPGVTVGHSAARQAFSVAATPAAKPFGSPLEPGDPANPTGPFPGSFGPNTQVERFSSDGPRRVFYESDGTPITPGNVSASGGEVRQKPDLTAADGVSTSISDFNPFFGTSAAAPHAAAIAGLVLSGNPDLHPKEMREALVNTAADIELAGTDVLSGAGVLLADRVLAYTGASPQPVAVAKAPAVAAPDGYLDPGETAKLTLPVTNTGDGAAVSTSVVLTSPTPGVTITPRSKSYGTISPKQTGVNEFGLTVPTTHELGEPVLVDVKVSFAGAHSPTTVRFPLPVGKPSPVATDFAYTGAPVAIPDNNQVGVSVPIQVAGVGRASKLTFSLDGSTCSTDQTSTAVGLSHSYVGDLVGTLTAPSGAQAVVFQRNGSSGNNLCQVVFTDSAARAFSSVTFADAPFTGSWRPAVALSGLAAERVDGTWTFHARDVAGGDAGTIRAVSLHINGYVSGSAAGKPAQAHQEVRNGPVRPV